MLDSSVQGSKALPAYTEKVKIAVATREAKEVRENKLLPFTEGPR